MYRDPNAGQGKPPMDRSSALRRTAQILRRPAVQAGGNETPGINPGARPNVRPKPPAPSSPQQPQKPAWQQLREKGIEGQGSAAENKAKFAEIQKPQILTAMPPEKPGIGGGSLSGGLEPVDNGPGSNVRGGPEVISNSGGFPAVPPGSNWSDDPGFSGTGGPQFQSGGGFMAEPMPTDIKPPRLRGFAPQGASPDLMAAIRSARGSAGPGASAPGASLAERLAGAKPSGPMEPAGDDGEFGSSRPVGGPGLLRRRQGQLGANPEARGMGGYSF